MTQQLILVYFVWLNISVSLNNVSFLYAPHIHVHSSHWHGDIMMIHHTNNASKGTIWWSTNEVYQNMYMHALHVKHSSLVPVCSIQWLSQSLRPGRNHIQKSCLWESPKTCPSYNPSHCSNRPQRHVSDISQSRALMPQRNVLETTQVMAPRPQEPVTHTL